MKRQRSDQATKTSPGPMNEVIPLYAQYLLSINQNSNAYRYARDLKRMCAHFGWQTSAQLPATVIEQVRSAFSHQSAYRKQLAIIGFLRWAHGRYRINEAALAVTLIRPPLRPTRAWTLETEEHILTSARAPIAEIETALEAAGIGPGNRHRVAEGYYQRRQYLYGALLLALRWAVRRLEIVELLVRDWDPSRGILTIRRSSTRRQQPRSFPVDRQTADALDAQCGNRGPDAVLFPAAYGRHLHMDQLSRDQQNFFRQIGMRGSLQDCHRYAVRSIIERMSGREQEAFAIIGFARRTQGRLYAAHSEAAARERVRAQAVFEDIACHFRSPVPQGGEPAAPDDAMAGIPDFLELLRPLLPALMTGSGSPQDQADT